MATTSISPLARSKGYLVRGIDPIPENWEDASGFRALGGLRRALTVLTRLIGEAVKAGHKPRARDLRSIRTAVQHGLDHMTGGFVIKEIEPKAKQWAKCKRQAQREIHRCMRPAVRLVVDNTQVRP
jgi:hypothetical protein